MDNGLCMFSWVHFGAGIRALFLEGLVIHSPAFANVHRELVVATSSQQRIVFFSLLSLPHSLHLGFELELETLFFSLLHYIHAVQEIKTSEAAWARK